jgi:hypothetical protein
MTSRTKRTLAVLVVLLAAGALALFAWLPWDPFEEPAGPLDSLVPRDVDSAWRFDGPSLRASAFAAEGWRRPEVLELRARCGLGEDAFDGFGRIESAMSFAGELIDPPSIERDLLPAEAIVATRGADVLLVARISERAKAVQLARKLPERRLHNLGMEVAGPLLALRDGAPQPVFFVVHRDVLLASSSEGLARDALRAAEEGTGALRGRDDARAALDLDRPAGASVLGWVRPAALLARLGSREPEGERPFWADLLTAGSPLPLRVRIDLAERDALTVTADCAWDDGLPESVRRVFSSSAADAADLTAAAERLAVPDEAIVAGGLSVSAAEVLRALLSSQPEETQAAFDEALASAGESVERVAGGLSRNLDDGVAFVVARLLEADHVLGGDAPGAVRAIPATLVRFRLRGPGAEAALLDALRRRAQTLFGGELEASVTTLGDGTRFHTIGRRGLAGQWDLFRPAFAFRDDEFVFSTHEGYLRRALAPGPVAARDRRAGSPSGAALTGVLHAAPLRAWIADQAWQAADQATWRDWAAERARIEATMSPSLRLRPQDRVTYLDARIQEMKRRRRETEIPEAVDAYSRRWTWLETFGDARFAADVDPASGRLTLHARVTLRAE